MATQNIQIVVDEIQEKGKAGYDVTPKEEHDGAFFFPMKLLRNSKISPGDVLEVEASWSESHSNYSVLEFKKVVDAPARAIAKPEPTKTLDPTEDFSPVQAESNKYIAFFTALVVGLVRWFKNIDLGELFPSIIEFLAWPSRKALSILKLDGRGVTHVMYYRRLKIASAVIYGLLVLVIAIAFLLINPFGSSAEANQVAEVNTPSVTVWATGTATKEASNMDFLVAEGSLTPTATQEVVPTITATAEVAIQTSTLEFEVTIHEVGGINLFVFTSDNQQEIPCQQGILAVNLVEVYSDIEQTDADTVLASAFEEGQMTYADHQICWD